MKKKKTSKTAPVNTYDVIVCGGGSAGLGAALAVAQQGLSTLLIEQFNFLGGTATASLNFGFVQTIGMNGPAFKKLYQRMQELGGVRKEYFDPETYKMAAQTMMLDAGVKLLFHTFMESAHVENGRIKGVYVVNKGGFQFLGAKMVIDATGDADVAFSAGVECKKGREHDGRMQALTLRPRIGGVADKGAKVDWKRINELLEEERKKGTVRIPPYVVGYLDAGGVGVRHERTFNLDMAAEIDATDPWQLTHAEIEARKRVWELLSFMRKNVPGWENAYLIDTGVLIGIRETRRIVGKYVLSRDDVMKGGKFKDGIARCSFWVDMHDPEIFQYPGGLGAYIKAVRLPEGEWYEIPYACLVPEKVEGLLVCGRCISSDREANGSVRIMPTCMNTGTAAGIGAAMALLGGVEPSLVNGVEVRKRVLEAGGDL
ncbi:MAG: FAD-dependent oxidoreductase [Verrucomicrobiae bacterium]|nr:FAD-dependent oxidoreductase [Verrucomicrobiae bacterium]